MQVSPVKAGKVAQGATKKRKKAPPIATALAAPAEPVSSWETVAAVLEPEPEDLTTEASTLLAQALAGCRTPRATPRGTILPPQPSERLSSGVLSSRLLLGITVAGIEEILASREVDAVTFAQTKAKRRQYDGYVNQVLCKQEALEDELSSCERLHRAGSKAVGAATVFVSWPFATVLETLVDALKHHLREARLDADATFFWIADFCVCQARPAADLAKLPEVIAAVGCTAMLLEPWSAPGDSSNGMCAPLRRCWCLWELYLTAKCSAAFTPLMSEMGCKAFRHTLTMEFEGLQDLLSELDVAASETTTRKDKDMILDAVSRSLGLQRFNFLVRRLILAAVADAAAAQMEQLEDSERTPTLKHHVAALLHEARDLNRAAPLYAEALSAYRATLGDAHLDTLLVTSTLAQIYADSGKLAEAETLMFEEVAASREALGTTHPSTLTCLNNLAVFLSDKGDLAGAEPLYREALAAQRAELGDADEDTTLSMNNLASLLRARGEIDAATALHEEALSHQRKTLGDTHPTTLSSMYNLGCLLFEHGDAKKAEVSARERMRARAPSHPERASERHRPSRQHPSRRRVLLRTQITAHQPQ